MNISLKLKSQRESKNITLEQVSKQLGWPISKLSKIENGNQNISIDDLNLLCDAIGTTVNNIIGEAKLYSDDNTRKNIVSLLEKIINSYNSVNKENFAGNETIRLISKDIPNSIAKSIDLNSEKFKIKGSGGNGQPAEIPWISIFNRSITDTATKGLYLVFLIKADFSGLYLSLNQGFTYFKEKYGTKDGKIKIRKAASKIRKNLNTLPLNSMFDINLQCINPLGKGYESGNIAAKYYSMENMPSESELIDDIREYILCYEELKSMIGLRTVDQFYEYLLIKDDGYEISEEDGKESLNESLGKYIVNKKEKASFKGLKKEKKVTVLDNEGKEVYLRDSKIASNAIEIADYKCEIDENHKSFTRKTNMKNYTESHHLIPMSFQDDFKYSLDIEENIVSVCSTCHNCLHYGIDEERIELLQMLYEQRKEHLNKVGLSISFEELKRYYKISEFL